MHTETALGLSIAPNVKLPGRWLRQITLFNKTHQPLGREKTEGLCCQLEWRSEAALLSSSLLVPLLFVKCQQCAGSCMDSLLLAEVTLQLQSGCVPGPFPGSRRQSLWFLSCHRVKPV